MMVGAQFTYAELLPVRGNNPQMKGARLSSNLRMTRGQILALVTAAAASEAQTIAFTGVPTAGGYLFAFNGYQFTLSVGTTAAQAKAILEALPNIGTGNVNVTGGALPTVINITFQNALANLPQPLITKVTNSLTGGTAPDATVARTTAGVAYNRYVPYNGTQVTAPVAPTVAGNGAGSAFAAGTHLVQMTFLTAAGESTPSPASAVTLTAAQNIRVSAVASVNATYTTNYGLTPITGANFYVDGVWTGTVAISGGNIPQTDLTGAALAQGKNPPQTNTAFVYGDGTQSPRLILKFDVTTNERGLVNFGSASTSQHGASKIDVPAYEGGIFRYGDLIGCDQYAISSMLGRFLSGSIADPNSEIMFPT